MILSFETEELRTICEDPDVATSQLGEDVAGVLRLRLADLRAVDCIDDMPVGRTTRRGQECDLLEVELADEVVMTFESNHKRPRITDTGSVDWPQVRRIRLTQIGRPS